MFRRVGRGARQSSCILLYGGVDAELGETARERLETLRRTDDGFVIAQEDFRLRGGGDPLGLRQSGFPAYRFADPIRHRTRQSGTGVIWKEKASTPRFSSV